MAAGKEVHAWDESRGIYPFLIEGIVLDSTHKRKSWFDICIGSGSASSYSSVTGSDSSRAVF